MEILDYETYKKFGFEDLPERKKLAFLSIALEASKFESALMLCALSNGLSVTIKKEVLPKTKLSVKTKQNKKSVLCKKRSGMRRPPGSACSYHKIHHNRCPKHCPYLRQEKGEFFE